MQNISELRKRYNLSRKQLSELTNIPVRTIQSWELGEREAPEYIYPLIESRLDVILKISGTKTILTPQVTSDINLIEINSILRKEYYSLSKEDITKLNTAFISQMLNERDRKDRGGIYGYTQRALAYNSSKIEGNRLSEEETRYLFELNQLPEGEFRTKDIEEMTGHFLMFNYALSNINETLSEDIIKGMHKELQSGVFEFRANGGIPGEYKHRKNIVGNTVTSNPEDVKRDIQYLLADYHREMANDVYHINTLSIFHSRYEQIHPFQDGNGRTGRMILFRECLKQGLVPFIIDDAKKIEYYEALRKAVDSKDYLPLNTLFENEAKNFYSVLQEYMYDHSITLSDSEHEPDDLE